MIDIPAMHDLELRPSINMIRAATSLQTLLLVTESEVRKRFPFILLGDKVKLQPSFINIVCIYFLDKRWIPP